MRNPSELLLLDGLLAVYGGLDLFRTLKSGRANTWMNGTATRRHQPARYWRYVYEGWAVLGFCGVVFVWVIL